MSGMASILLELGASVSGSDLKESSTTTRLVVQGAKISIGTHQAEHIPSGCDLVIFSSAVNPTNKEYIEAKAQNIRLVRRGIFLAELAKGFTSTIAVSGSHGKTTTTAMLVHIFKSCGLDPAYMIGGSVIGNGANASAGDQTVFITEIDESDGTQAFFKPHISLILNIEDDHAWSAGGVKALFESFQSVARVSNHCFAWKSHDTTKLLSPFSSVEFIDQADIPNQLEVPQIGLHNLIDATMAMKAALAYGLDQTQIIDALSTFPGVKRRMTTHGKDESRNLILLEDYAHHPTELDFLYHALRGVSQGKELAIIFQPHRYERVKRYHKEFSEVLAKFDKVILVPPFAAWKQDSALADPKLLLVDSDPEKVKYCEKPLTTVPQLALDFFPTTNAIIAVVGAGDVASIIPELKNKLEL